MLTLLDDVVASGNPSVPSELEGRSILLRSILLAFLFIAVTSFSKNDAKATEVPKVTGLTQTQATTTSVSISWDQILGTNVYYEYALSTDGVNYTEYASKAVSKAECTISSLATGTVLYAKVRSFTAKFLYSTPVNERVYGEYSEPIVIYVAPEAISFSSTLLVQTEDRKSVV